MRKRLKNGNTKKKFYNYLFICGEKEYLEIIKKKASLTKYDMDANLERKDGSCISLRIG